MKLYLDHNNLWVKVATDQKAESLVAGVLSKLDNKTNNKSISNKKYAEFSTKWLVLLHYHNTTCAYNYPFNLVPKNPKSVPLLQSIFTSLFTSQLSLQSPLTIPSSIPQQFFTSLFLHTNIPAIYTKNVFPNSAI